MSVGDSLGAAPHTAGEEQQRGAFVATELALDAQAFGSPGEEPHTHQENGLYLPMARGEFAATDLSIADADERIRYLRMKVRMVRDRRETPEASTYFDNIERAYEDSFASVTSDVLADPTKMNLIRCVDPYSDKQLDELSFSPEEQIQVPGGLGWLDVTGLMDYWIVPRIFNKELAVGLHRNCGGFAILGALNGERQAVARDRAVENAHRIMAETAATVRKQYLTRRGHKFDPEVAEVLSTFGGPKLTVATGDVGTAEDFVTPKALQGLAVEQAFTPREIVDGVECWIDDRINNKLAE